MVIEELRERYVGWFGHEPAKPGAVASVEIALDVVLPSDLKEIARFYSGGMVGGISHHAIDSRGPATNLVRETMRLRDTIQLPRYMFALAEPPASLVVLHTNARAGEPAVIWLDETDANRLIDIASLRSPDTWPSYSEFFSYPLDSEQEERDEEAGE